MDHPDPLVLEQQTLPPDVSAHLEGCARCRIDRRVLYGPETDVGPVDDGLPEPAALVRTWRSARAGSVVDASEPPVEVAPPTGLGPYRVDARLGSGGMAVVFRVCDQRDGRLLALKLLRRSDPDLQRRLKREGRVQQALRHPNLVPVLDILEVEGSPALLLEYVSGPSLKQVLHDGLLPLEVVDRVADEVLAGMAEAHGTGVIHRDLKPGNVLMEPVDEGFRARVTDFGLARGRRGEDSLNTRTGAFAGTPMYMAPEQLRDASRADARSDVFSLGALLYELLTGERAFAGLDYVDIVRRVADVRWTPVEEVRPGVPERMRKAIGAALQVEPDARPEDAGALRALWSARSPDARWPEQRVLAGLARHRPDPVAVEESPGPETNLQAYEDTFVERATLRQDLLARLERERLVTLTGPGGVGKTRMAVELARSVVHEWPGGAWFCDLTAARSVEGIASAVAEALGVRLSENPVAAVGSALAGRGRALVLLDNFEQVVEHAEATVEPWLERAPEVRFVVTSREPLDLFDEAVLPLDILDREAARALFASRARRVLPDFALTDDNRDAVDQIVERLDGLPLAIEIVAARVRSRSLERILSHLERFRGDRHAALRGTLDASWDLLEPEEREALLRLTVFEGAADPSAVEAVLGPRSSAVDGLVRRSLARRVGDRVRLLVPIRQWATAKRSEEEALQAEQAHGAWAGSLDPEAADPYFDDVLAAYGRATARSDVDTAHGAGRNAVRLLERRGPVRRALEVADEMLANPALGQERRASWLQQRGRLTAHFGDPNRAQDDLREAQSWGRTLGDVDLEINATNWLGIAKASSGDHEGALTCFHEALAVAEAHDLAQHVAFINGGIAGSSKYLGDLKKSRHHYETALAGHRALGNDRGIALVQGDLGLVDLAEKDYATAKARIVEAIEILARQNNPVSEAVGWHELAQVYQAQELYDDAREALQTALERLRRTGATLHEVYLLRMLADLEREATGLEAASAWMEEALGVARDLDVPGAVYSTLRQLAAIRRAQGSPQQAERLEAQADQLEAEDQASRTV